MKILNIIEEGRFGGPQKSISLIAQELNNLNVQTTVIVGKKNSENFARSLNENKIPFLLLNIQRPSAMLFDLINYFVSFPIDIYRICNVIKKANPDIIQCNGALQIKGILSSRMMGKKVIWVMNDTSTSNLFKSIVNKVAVVTDGVIFASEASRDYFSGLVKRRNKVIPAPVEISKFLIERSRISERKFLSKTDKCIIFVGNINFLKGIEYYIRIAHIFQKKGQNQVIFYVIGPVPSSQKRYFRKLKKMIEEEEIRNIKFMGFQEDIPQILKEADLYINCSISESSPMNVWEAMTAGLPIITTSVGDVARYFPRELSKYVFEVGDYKGMAERANEILMSSEKERNELGDRLSIIAKKSFDSKELAKLHLEFHRETLE